MIWQETLAIAAGDGAAIPVHRWLPNGTPRAVVQIAHGWGEYGLRYLEIGETLASSGFAVYINDHRGHGMASKSLSQLGDFDDVGFIGLVSDMRDVTDLALSEHPGTPIVLLGHSMGSYAVQLYLLDHSHVLSAAALSGGSALDLRIGKLGRLAWYSANNNNAFEPSRTAFDWLCRDKRVVDAYLDDPLCAFVPTPASQNSIIGVVPRLSDVGAMAAIRPSLPVHLFTGEHDPVNGFLEYFTPLVNRYRQGGLRQVSSYIFEGARHETLRETNKQEVFGRLIDWLGDAAMTDPRHSPAARRPQRIAFNPLLFYPAGSRALH